MVRLATEQDIPGIVQLLLQVGEVHHQIRPDIFRNGCLKYDETALKALLQDKDRPVFVAMDEGSVAGYCFCVLREYQGTGVSTHRREIYIDDLCVDEHHRGQGIATRLYRHTLDYAKTLDCQFVTLNVWCGNQIAMDFYAKMGLTPRNITLETKL